MSLINQLIAILTRGCFAALLFFCAGLINAEGQDSQWWSPGDDRIFPAFSEYENASGRFGIINTSGPIDTRNHPFFTATGSNGRACVTCHQPSDAMSLSVSTIQKRWQETNGKDPLFAAIDGSNCPSLPQGERESHSLLLEKGLIRIPMPWPPRPFNGKEVTPEFSIKVIRDPTGCNLDPQWGLNSENPAVSVFRRPRPVINIAHLMELPHGVAPFNTFFFNDAMPLPKGPDTGKPVPQQLMADGRGLTPKHQAKDAALTHLQMFENFTEEQLQQIEAFEKQLYGAQSYDKVAGDLTGKDSPPGLGPNALVISPKARLGNNPLNKNFGDFSIWTSVEDQAQTPQNEVSSFKASVARGASVFRDIRFYINDVGMYNDKGLGNPFKRSCGSGCHNTLSMGMDLSPGFMDIGLNNLPWQNQRSDLPLFKITCHEDVMPHAFLGREIYTHDPGRSLITGRCTDVGATMTQQMRGLAARAPYFVGGASANLRELVDFYDRRFNIGYTEQEKVDLVNFMRTL